MVLENVTNLLNSTVILCNLPALKNVKNEATTGVLVFS